MLFNILCLCLRRHTSRIWCYLFTIFLGCGVLTRVPLGPFCFGNGGSPILFPRSCLNTFTVVTLRHEGRASRVSEFNFILHFPNGSIDIAPPAIPAKPAKAMPKKSQPALPTPGATSVATPDSKVVSASPSLREACSPHAAEGRLPVMETSEAVFITKPRPADGLERMQRGIRLYDDEMLNKGFLIETKIKFQTNIVPSL